MRVAVFVDGSNFFHMQQKSLPSFIDPKKLLNYVSSNIGEIQDAYYYTGHNTPPLDNQEAYFDALSKMGYSLIRKPIKTIYDQETGENRQKANLDIEIVLDMFNTIDNYDLAVLVSGDGDFDRPLQLLKARRKKFKIMSTDKFLAKELRQIAGMHFINFEDIFDIIKK